MSIIDIKGIIFDLGSTLIEFEFMAWDEMMRTGQRFAYDHLDNPTVDLPDFETFSARLEKIKSEYRKQAAETLVEWSLDTALEKIFSELGLDNVRARSKKASNDLYDALRAGFTPCEGARELLQKLKQGGYRIGLISNTIFPARVHEVDLDKFGLKPYIDFRIYSSEYGYRKPYPGIYSEGLRLIDLPPERVLFVGDRYVEDVEGPRRAGMSAVLKYHAGRTYPDPMPADIPVINRLSELSNMLKV